MVEAQVVGLMKMPVGFVNICIERTKEHLVAFIEIAFVSILSRRLARLTTQKISA
jgi:hypothetical protein